VRGFLLAAIALIESASGPDRHQAAENAQAVMVQCFFAKAPTLDDRVSDAATIAHAIVRACYPQVEDCKRAYFEEMRPRYDALKFYKQFDDAVPDLALQTILKVRAK
jgi:hypothetical protein